MNDFNNIISPDKISNTVIAVLAGGQARRMNGIDKGLVLYKEKPLIAHVLERLMHQSNHIVINANRNINAYESSGYPVVVDDFLDNKGMPTYQGPLAGMLSVMQFVQSNDRYEEVEYVTFVPCDAPHVPLNLVEKSLARLNELKADIAVPFAMRTQPVFATVKLELMPSLYEFLETGERKIDKWFDQHYWIQVDFNKYTPNFANYNTPEDLSKDVPRLKY